MAHAAPLPEPKTPLWFTALGIGLFLLAGLILVLRSPAPEKAVVEAKVAAAPPPTPKADAPPRPGARPTMDKAPPQLDPSALKGLAERLKQQQQGAQGAPPAGGH